MDTVITPCLRCTRPLAIDTMPEEPQELRCGHCHAKQIQAIYPAAYGEREDSASIPAADDGATCYFHLTSDAANLCDDCGRYLCDVCTLPIPMPANNPPDFPRQLCPACFENRVQREVSEMQWDLFRTSYPRYDVIAGVLIVAPIVFFPLALFSIFTFPAAVYILLRHWRHNRTPVERFRRSMIVTLGVGIFGIAVWLLIVANAIVESF